MNAKVIELSRKNRSLNLLLERERQRVASLQQSLSEASAAASTRAAAGAGGAGARHSAAGDGADGAGAAADPAAAAARDAAHWRERAQQQTNKLAQLEQRLFVVDAENRKMARALAREVGDEVPLARVLDEGSDWKGRREAIVALRDTVRRLREELKVRRLLGVGWGGGGVSTISPLPSCAISGIAHGDKQAPACSRPPRNAAGRARADEARRGAPQRDQPPVQGARRRDRAPRGGARRGARRGRGGAAAVRGRDEPPQGPRGGGVRTPLLLPLLGGLAGLARAGRVGQGCMTA